MGSLLRLFLTFSLMGLAVTARANQFGGLAGVNIADASVLPAAATQSETRFMGGVFYESSLAPALAIQPEALYVGKAGGLDYLAVPLFLKLKLDIALIKPFAMAGPEFAFKISNSAAHKMLDIALDFGGGVELSMGPVVNLILCARYSMGLTNVLSNPLPGNEAKTRGLHLLGGIGIEI